MRYVRHGATPPEDDWIERARIASEEAAAAQSVDERRNIIRKYATLWRELKPLLEAVAGKKCWYCESREVRSDKHVDHFRPKGRVSEQDCANHPGYWWLAFDWKNFRFCCTFCNSRRLDIETGHAGGKSDRFPLKDNATRCHGPADPLSGEQPALLDPVEIADPELLWFIEDGTAVPRHGIDEASWPNLRATTSIEVYHLNHADLVEARLDVCRKCKDLVADADRLWVDFAAGTPAAEAQFKTILQRIHDIASGAAVYSSCARATLMGLRATNRIWLDALIAAA